MKRIIAIILSVIMLIPAFSCYTFAAAPACNLLFEVTSNGENEIYVNAGEEITVDFTVTNTTDSGTFTITNLQNHIEFDQNFFEYVDGNVEHITATSSKFADNHSWGAKTVQILALHVSGGKAKVYENRQLVARVTFKVKDGLAQGTSGKLINVMCEAADGINYSSAVYPVSSKGMTVYIGSQQQETFTVTYKNGENVVFTDDSVVKDSEISIYQAPSAQQGKKFAGWKDEDGRLFQPGDKYTVTEDVTFTAEWYERYALHFNTGDGSDISSVSGWEGDTIDLSGYVPVKDGYDFDGWYLDQAFTNKVTSVTLTENKTVYAKWKIKEFTLTFETNGGNSITAVTDVKGTVVDLSNYTPVKTGYVFEGWHSDSALTNKVTSITLNDNTTVYAKWKEIEQTYTLTFETNGGNSITAVTDVKGTVVNLSNYTPVKTGYVFEGWHSDSACTSKVTSVTLDSNITVYAKWKALDQEFTLTFNTNGGNTISPFKAIKGTVVNLSAYTPVKSGYNFKGWYTDSALTQKVTSVTLNNNITVYAAWEKVSTPVAPGGSDDKNYTISFETAGGSVIVEVTKKEDAVVDLSQYVPKKDGYIFAGWYTDEELTKKVTHIKVTSDITLYAKWIKIAEESDSAKPDILTDEHFAYIVGRENSMICPKDSITRAEAATVFFRLLKEEVRNKAMTKNNSFDDVNEGDWFNTAVSTLAALKIVEGRKADTFAPNAPITRAELTTIVARLSDATYDGENIFDDIEGHWAENYINVAAYVGWVKGDGNSLFRPNDNITRAEVMTLINRVLGRQPESKADLHKDMKTWADNSDENAWYYLAVQEATNSHEYQKKPDGIHEKWTVLVPNPDWTSLEK